MSIKNYKKYWKIQDNLWNKGWNWYWRIPLNFTVCSDIMITVDRGNRDRRCKRHDFKEVCLMLALLGGLAGLAASATGTLVSTAIPVIGGHLAAGAATIGAAAGAGAVVYEWLIVTSEHGEEECPFFALLLHWLLVRLTVRLLREYWMFVPF